MALLRDDRCLVAQRPANTSFPLTWELPGGKVEAEETPREALVREIREELAIHIQVGEFIGRGEGSVGASRIVLDVYSGRISRGEPKPLQHAAITWCNADELSALTWPQADVPIVEAVQELLRAAPTK